MKKMSALKWVVAMLLIVGGLNWGLVGLLRLNLVYTLFGTSMLARAIYILVGAAALYQLFSLFVGSEEEKA